MDLFINCRKFQINAGPEKLQNVIVRDQWEFLTTLTTFSIKTSHNLIQESRIISHFHTDLRYVYLFL